MRVQDVGLDAAQDAPKAQHTRAVVERLPRHTGPQIVHRDTLLGLGVDGDEMHVVSARHEIGQPSFRVNVSADGKIRNPHKSLESYGRSADSIDVEHTTGRDHFNNVIARDVVKSPTVRR